MIKIFILIFIVLISRLAAAQNCDSPQNIESTRIYFVNGMNNAFTSDGVSEMVASRIKLENLLGREVGAFGNSFNFKENGFYEIKQVALQRAIQPVEFWQILLGMKRSPIGYAITPQWMLDAAANAAITKAKELNAKQYFTDKDLQTMVDQYVLDLKSGKKVVLVTHSQGNFYANNAYIYIKTIYPQYANSIGIVMTASPASINASGGPHVNNDKDLILLGVKLFYPVLPYTGTYHYDFLDHSFDDVYLAKWEGGGGQDSIKLHVYNMINTLQTPTKHIDCVTVAEIPVQIATWAATNITGTSGKLNGYVTSGQNIYTWFNYLIGNPNVGSCASLRNVYPGGTQGVGPVSVELVGLPSNTTIYYRACAIGTGNRISDGIVMSFQTLAAAPSPITTRNLTLCASWTTLYNPQITGLYSYQSVGVTVNSVAYGSFGFNPSVTSPQCVGVLVKNNFNNAFIFYLTNTHENDIGQPYQFYFYNEYGQSMNRSCNATWTLQRRYSFTCYQAF